MAAADDWWRRLITDLRHDVAAPASVLELPGCGPVAFGSFCFDPATTRRRSTLIVPEVIIGRRDGQAWITTVGRGQAPDPFVPDDPAPPQGPGIVTWQDGPVGAEAWRTAVQSAVARITSSALDKVVLARQRVATSTDPIDPRWVLGALTTRYQQTWAFWVDDMIGASPEMLVRRQGGLVTSRVLAGTIWQTPGRDSAAIAAAIAASGKDLVEHEYAVRSVAQALAPHCSGMNVPDSPYVLELPNVSHLATDVTAVARPGTTALSLAAALHPSAAVCGTPTAAARAVIADLEQMDRGRYSGPVGWMDIHGDGEWAIALRCGRLVDDHTLHAYAGCGIVADSDPATELAESRAKFAAMTDALAVGQGIS